MSANVVYVMSVPGSGTVTIVSAGLAALRLPHRIVNCAILGREEIFETLAKDPEKVAVVHGLELHDQAVGSEFAEWVQGQDGRLFWVLVSDPMGAP